MKRRNNQISKISLLHYMKLMLRSILLVAALICYIRGKASILKNSYMLPMVVWILFFSEMILRFFPSKLESMGCQKQFRKNYSAVEGAKPVNISWKRTALVAVSWLALNAVIGTMYFNGLIDAGILMLVSIAFSVCDIVCILFFCPFQTWIMKNRCCTTCRIYNWDFAMMFTPLVFIPGFYTYSLLGCAILLLLRWEITYRCHPERFSDTTNRCLHCTNCAEKLCNHKTQLRTFWKRRNIQCSKKCE